MVHLGVTSGPWQLVYQKEGFPTNNTIALAVILVIPIIQSHLHLLEITTTVSQAIQPTGGLVVICTPLTLSGMASSVRVSVAAMENLLHGSVWSYQTQQLMILRSAYVWVNQVMMTLPLSCLNSMSSTIKLKDYMRLVQNSMCS